MKIEKRWETFGFYTKALTEQSRKLAFAVAAICWFFKSDDVTFPWAITVALAFVVLYFILDVLHYFVAASLIKGLTLKQEAELEEKKGRAEPEDDVENPPSLDDWPERLF